MDEFLALVGVQAMRYTIRSAVGLTSTYALKQCSRLLQSVDDKLLYSELRNLQTLLDSKIKIISPALELVEFKSSRGNVFLESAAPLARALQREIASLGQRIEGAIQVESETDKPNTYRFKTQAKQHEQLREIISDIKALLERIDREIPLLQLAITASGETLSTSLPTNVSPSRLLQASALLIVGDTQYAQDPTRTVQIGPAFHLSLYMLFLGHASVDPQTLDLTGRSRTAYGIGEHDRKPLWQEVSHKTRVRLCRSQWKQQQGRREGIRDEDSPKLPESPLTGAYLDYAYHLEIVEDLDDGRVHSEQDTADIYEDIPRAGFRELIPINQLAKVFYTDTGKILNIGNDTNEENSPVLLLKRDLNAPRLSPASSINVLERLGTGRHKGEAKREGGNMLPEGSDNHESISRRPVDDIQDACARASSSLPSHLDPEWIAFEVFEADDTAFDETETEVGSESEPEDRPTIRSPGVAEQKASGRASLDARVAAQIRNLSLQPSFGYKSAPGGRRSSTGSHSSRKDDAPEDDSDFVARSPFKAITSSLSLIEMLIRLASLQEFQQAPHLSIPDHILAFFLEESSTTGLSGDARQAMRKEAKQRVGFDPYTDGPEN
ncbi:Ran-specific GTPase-activating protein 30 [Purpureocillium takamizusanense]|uniref:Ran-specific GTPase-activating protein 30 n=1 Tax=Purpureocillium takamizusanense TaxID=2060973 RepID=A0A9Q8QN46_9HYPO|nr:Ran-specific GTPase-activating protein 30 [Purpureocillium takamizusanense]UNI22703.1 Ran-specific GTPase-activating protein 30 [Purpureocillium takamizusanense]